MCANAHTIGTRSLNNRRGPNQFHNPGSHILLSAYDANVKTISCVFVLVRRCEHGRCSTYSSPWGELRRWVGGWVRWDHRCVSLLVSSVDVWSTRLVGALWPFKARPSRWASRMGRSSPRGGSSDFGTVELTAQVCLPSLECSNRLLESTRFRRGDLLPYAQTLHSVRLANYTMKVLQG